MSRIDISREVLENQKVIILALSKLLTPLCKGGQNDLNGETGCNVELIDRYKQTENILLDWGEIRDEVD